MTSLADNTMTQSPNSSQTRLEKDSMGDMHVPADALYGASTQRAVENFPISNRRMPKMFIRAMGLLKFACAKANLQLDRLDAEKSQHIQDAGLEIFQGQLREHFPVDVFQTGSCTSSNMNINEVIANRISQKCGQPIGSKTPVHPNDDVNMGQSSNDTMPSCLHISVAMALKEELIPALEFMHAALDKKAQAWASLVKIGRTHLMDATPLTLGQEFSGYASQVQKSIDRANKGIESLAELAIGGTAVGTGINGHPDFARIVTQIVSEKTGIAFREADNHFEAQAARDDSVEVAGYLSAIASSLTKIASDIRLMGSGPRSGIRELVLPATQPGSSIMPGKVNPVMSEMLVQVCIYVMGNAQSVNIAGRDGHFELNVTIPLIVHCLQESIYCLSNAIRTFTEKCIDGLEADEPRCKDLVERSLMLVTALNPFIGYDKAAAVAKKAYNENRTLKEVLISEKIMDADEAEKALDASKMVKPQA